MLPGRLRCRTTRPVVSTRIGSLHPILPCLYAVTANGRHAAHLPVTVRPFTALQRKGYCRCSPYTEFVKVGASVARHFQRKNVFILAALTSIWVICRGVQKKLPFTERIASATRRQLLCLPDVHEPARDFIFCHNITVFECCCFPVRPPRGLPPRPIWPFSASVCHSLS